jgi:hypothetical protein
MKILEEHYPGRSTARVVPNAYPPRPYESTALNFSMTEFIEDALSVPPIPSNTNMLKILLAQPYNNREDL